MTKTRKRTNKPTTFEGLPLVDAAEDVSIVINKRDVSESKKKDPGNCAAALAGRRELNTDVRVYMTRVYVKDKAKKQWVRFITPMSIQKEIVSFDRGSNFEPGEYQFKAPSPSASLGYVYKGTGSGPKTGAPKKRPVHTTANVRISAKRDMKVGARSSDKG